jgi:hypothetical protein
MSIIEVKTRILPGGRIEIQSPGLLEGHEAEVQIRVLDGPPKRRISEILAHYPGGQLFRSAEEVDRYLKEEHDSWEN